MKILYNIDTIIKKLEDISGTSSILEDRLEKVYILNDITEDDLIDLEFKKVDCKDYLCYQKDNIFAYFKDNNLYVSEITVGE